MALRFRCSRMGRLARVATAALISVSTLYLVSAQAQAHHFSRHRYAAHTTHQVHYSHYARAPHLVRPLLTPVARPRVALLRGEAGFPVAGLPALVVDTDSGQTLFPPTRMDCAIPLRSPR